MLKTILLVSLSAAAGILLSIASPFLRSGDEPTPQTRQVVVTITEDASSTVFTVPLTGSERCGAVDERMKDHHHNLEVCSDVPNVYTVLLKRATTVDGEHVERNFRSRVRVGAGEMIEFAKVQRGKAAITATLAVR